MDLNWSASGKGKVSQRLAAAELGVGGATVKPRLDDGLAVARARQRSMELQQTEANQDQQQRPEARLAELLAEMLRSALAWEEDHGHLEDMNNLKAGGG